MGPRGHTYRVSVTWTGNRGSGTSAYRAYDRDHEVNASEPDNAHAPAGPHLPQPIAGSSDAAFRGDPGRWNPEQLLTAALSQCHMLAYLHLCAATGVVVTGYSDDAVATMTEDPRGGGCFTEAVLRPHVIVSSPQDIDKATALHEDAHEKCFIASSVNFPVRHEPVVVADAGGTPAPAVGRHSPRARRRWPAELPVMLMKKLGSVGAPADGGSHR